MGKKDVVMKQYMKDKVRFADLFNGSVFQGKEILRPENLTEGDGESDLYLKDVKGEKKAIARYHDILMKTDFAIFTEEGQADIHYAMPVRGMNYDALLYTDQVREIRKEHERNGDKLTGAEFLSGLTKGDKLQPVVSLVVYYGEKEWDASKDLHGMLDFGKSKELESVLRKVVPNYKINLLDVSRVGDTKIYKSDLHTLFEMLQYKQDKKGLLGYIEGHREQLKQIDSEAWDMLGVMLHEEKRFEKYRRQGRGEETMCKAIDDLFEDLMNEGRMQVQKEADEKVKKVQENAQSNLIKIAKSLKEILSCEVIAEKMDLPLDVVINL